MTAPGPLWAWEWSKLWRAAQSVEELRAVVRRMAPVVRPLLVTAADHLRFVRLLLFSQGSTTWFRNVADDRHPLGRLMQAVNEHLAGRRDAAGEVVRVALVELVELAEAEARKG